MRYPYPTVRIDAVDQWIEKNEDMLLVDLRNREEYRQGHLKGAVNIPYGELTARYGELPSDRTLVLYCSRGAQSMRVCNNLARLGYQVVNTAGGLAYYRGKYMEKGSVSEGNVDRNSSQDLQW